jgi:biotin transport system ATP-binding protein
MIEVRAVTHRYGDGDRDDDGGARPALDGVDLTVADGEALALVGANGSGKTTLVRTFNGLLTPDAGAVLVDGTPVAEDPVAARTAVGMVFQDPRDQIVAATVGADVAFGPENLGLARGEIDRRVREALDAVGMAGRGDDRVEALSGGERARVAVAGALAMEPTHLVLDEPFAGLDAPSRASVRDRLRESHAAGTSLVVVTHDLADAAGLVDRVVCLSGGRVVVDDALAAARDRLPTFGVRVPPASEAP